VRIEDRFVILNVMKVRKTQTFLPLQRILIMINTKKRDIVAKP